MNLFLDLEKSNPNLYKFILYMYTYKNIILCWKKEL